MKPGQRRKKRGQGRGFFRARPRKSVLKTSISLGGEKRILKVSTDASNAVLPNTIRIEKRQGFVKPAKEEMQDILSELKQRGFELGKG